MSYHIEDLYRNYKPHIFNRHMRFFYGKHYQDIDAVSRKTKKAILGPRLGKQKLKQRIKAVTVSLVISKNYRDYTELSDTFCPKCGCEATKGTGNMTEYPEVWYRSYCLRCGLLVSEADNSPDVHVLEFMCGEDKDEFDWKYWG